MKGSMVARKRFCLGVCLCCRCASTPSHSMMTSSLLASSMHGKIFALVRTLEAGFVPSLAVDPHEFIAAVRIDRQMHELVDHGPDGITGFGLAERPCLSG